MRCPKPFYRRFDHKWYVKIRDAKHPNGKYIPLGKRCERDDKAAEKAALEAYHAIMANKAPVTDSSRVADFVGKFLTWCEKHRPRSYSWYQRFLRAFVESIGGLTLAEIKAHHVQTFVDAKYKGAAGKAGAIKSICRAFSWGIAQGHVKSNPATGVERPFVKPRGEETWLTPAEVEAVIDASGSLEIYVRALVLTGARPGEIREAVCSDYDPAIPALVLPPERSKGYAKTKRQRVIYLSPDADLLIKQQVMKAGGEGRLFRNRTGGSISQSHVNAKFRRISKALKRKVIPYSLRHTWVSNSLQAGEPIAHVAALAGHSITICERVYGHVAANREVMQAAARRCAGANAAKREAS
jgi:integrase